MSGLEGIRFPVVAISRDSLGVFRDAEMLSVASPYAVKRGYFDGLCLLDAQGHSYRVAGVEVAREWFWKRPKTPFGRGVRIESFRVEREAAPALDQVRARVIAAIETDRETWEAGGDVSELLARIQAAETAAQLVAALLGGEAEAPGGPA